MNPDPTSLDRLHDIVAPPAAPWWPLAPGWNVLGTIVAVLILIAAVRAIHAWQQNRYRRDARRELRKLRQVAADTRSHDNVPAAIATVIKRTALTAWPREQVASLTGSAWWQFLDRASEVGRFAKDVGPMLDRSVYDDQFAATLSRDQLEQMFGAAEYWIEHHDRALAGC
jgi:hypothetical protein